MLYPACISLGMFVLVAVLLTVVFPKMLGVFSSLHVTLPVSTRILMWLSSAIKSFGMFFGVFAVAVVMLGIFYYRRSSSFRIWLDHVLMRLPLISKLIQVYALSSISNVIGLLMLNNSSVLSSLNVAAETCSNETYRLALRVVIEHVSQGSPLGASLAKFPRLFPTEYCDILGIGEQTGKLSETFAYAHVLYARDLDMLTKSLASSVEPVLMVVIGLAIGIVAFSVITPMYSITTHLHG